MLVRLNRRRTGTNQYIEVSTSRTIQQSGIKEVSKKPFCSCLDAMRSDVVQAPIFEFRMLFGLLGYLHDLSP